MVPNHFWKYGFVLKWSVMVPDHFWKCGPTPHPPGSGPCGPKMCQNVGTWRRLWTAHICMDHTLFMRSILVEVQNFDVWWPLPVTQHSQRRISQQWLQEQFCAENRTIFEQSSVVITRLRNSQLWSCDHCWKIVISFYLWSLPRNAAFGFFKANPGWSESKLFRLWSPSAITENFSVRGDQNQNCFGCDSRLSNNWEFLGSDQVWPPPKHF